MQDAITNVINKSDVQGLYLDTASMSSLESYFASGELRVRAAATISANASAIIRDAVAKALLYSDITRPGGNMYTTRRYAACIRDLDYYLRYSTYAMLAGDTSILDERVLNGRSGHARRGLRCRQPAWRRWSTASSSPDRGCRRRSGGWCTCCRRDG